MRVMTALMVPAIVSACRPAAPARPIGYVYAATELTTDVVRLERAIREGHAALFKYRSAADVDSIFHALRTDATHPMTAVDFWRATSRAVAGLRDNHTSVVPNAAIIEAIYRNPGRVLPLRLAVIDSTVYVVRNYSGSPGLVEGSRLVTINWEPAAKVIERCERYVPTDGNVASRAIRKLERDFDLTCGLALGLPPVLDVTAVNPVGEAGRFSVQSVSWRQRRASVVARDPRDTIPPERAELAFHADSTIAILTIRSFSKDGDFDVERFIDDAFRHIGTARSRGIVIDVRGNAGGRDTFAAHLYAKIAADTFTYYADRVLNKRRFQFVRSTDDWIMNYRALLISMQKQRDGRYHLRMAMDKPMRPDQQAFGGPVVMLVDGGTVSTSSELASLFKAKGRGLIVGEESGSAFGGGTGAVVSVVLSSTGLIVNVPIMSATMAPGRARAADPQRGVMPDVTVRPSIGDVLAGRDVMLDSAVALAVAAAR